MTAIESAYSILKNDAEKITEKTSNEELRISEDPPNAIMFIMDDLNDWVGPLGYSQIKTPNMDRLVNQGVKFTNAHAPGVYCAPSRTSIWTGSLASTTGCYENEDFHYDYQNLTTIQMALIIHLIYDTWTLY